MRLFDTHCHLGDEKLREHSAELLEQAVSAGVEALTVICADPENIREFDSFIPKLRALNKNITVYRSAGLHPHEAQHASPELYQLIESQLQSDAIGVGETGLDFFYDFSKPDVQIPVFEKHIDWSVQYNKPLIIHCREAAKDTLRLLNRPDVISKQNPGILHCFTETLDTAKQLVDWNFMISFSGILTFNNATDLREDDKWVPDTHLLIETDSPYLAPKPHRGRTNQPAYVAHTFELLCQLRGQSPEELSEILWHNSQKVFGL